MIQSSSKSAIQALSSALAPKQEELKQGQNSTQIDGAVAHVSLSEEARRLGDMPEHEASKASSSDPSMKAILWSKKVWQSNPSGIPAPQASAQEAEAKSKRPLTLKGLKLIGGEHRTSLRHRGPAPEKSASEQTVERKRKRLKAYSEASPLEAKAERLKGFGLEPTSSAKPSSEAQSAHEVKAKKALVVSTLRGRGGRGITLIKAN